VLVSHKASSGLQIDGTVTNSQDGTLVDITGATVTCGLKTDITSTNFNVFASGSVVSGTAGTFTVTLPASQWVTNTAQKIRYFGDVNISNLGNPLPSIELWLYPSANTGTETTYQAPANASWQTNGVDLGSVTVINFTTNVTAVNNGTTVEVYTASSGNGATPVDSGRQVTNTIPMGTNSITQIECLEFIPNGGSTNAYSLCASTDEDALRSSLVRSFRRHQ
jgi:hypothetical protein